MNTKISSNIIVLTAMIGLGGCAGTEPVHTIEPGQAPILSAIDAQSMIHVSVRTLPPPSDHETIVAKID